MKAGKIIITPQGDYVPGRKYNYLDIVQYNKSTYLSKINNNETIPNNELFWMKMTDGSIVEDLLHNSIIGRSYADAHPMGSITGLVDNIQQLTNSCNAINNKFTEQLEIVHADIKEAYVNTISYPIVDEAYNAQNTWITFNNKIYRCVKDTIWTGVITGDWELEYYTIGEVQTYVSEQIQAALAGEFPLQMRPDENYGVYQNFDDIPLTDNEPGYLTVVINSPGNGIYIWGVDPYNQESFAWIPFVVIEPVTQDTIMVTFNNETMSLKNAMTKIKDYVDSVVLAETNARKASENSINEKITDINDNGLIIGSNVFRGTQAQFDVDPKKDEYYLALIYEE